MNMSNKTIDQIIKDNNLTKEESAWFERMISMMMCLRKYERLRALYEKRK